LNLEIEARYFTFQDLAPQFPNTVRKGGNVMNRSYYYSLTISILVFLSTNCPSLVEASGVLPENPISYPVLINLIKDGSGSGFYQQYGDKLFLITARHVLFELLPGFILTENSFKALSSEKIDDDTILKLRNIINIKYDDPERFKESLNQQIGKERVDKISDLLFKVASNYSLRSNQAILLSYPIDETDVDKHIVDLNLESLNNDKLIKYSLVHDVAILALFKIDPYKGKLESIKPLNKGILHHYPKSALPKNSQTAHRLYKEVSISNDVFIFGYPRSLGIKESEFLQFDYSKPLLRRGIVAGKYDKLKTLIIDCPSYQGNSGGPVIQIEKKGGMNIFMFVGIVTEFIPFEERWINDRFGLINTQLSNSGYSVVESYDAIEDLLSTF